MLKNEMTDPLVVQGFYGWLSEEWQRCEAYRGTLENHAVTYLVTTNGGGAAAILAFAGSAGYANPWVYWSLGFFVVGLVMTGFAIVAGHRRLGWITRSLGNDHRAFNRNEIRSGQLEENHHNRFKGRAWGEVLGWVAFGLFLLGTASSTYTFQVFMGEKLEKAAREKAAQEAPKLPPVKEVSTAPRKGGE